MPTRGGTFSVGLDAAGQRQYMTFPPTNEPSYAEEKGYVKSSSGGEADKYNLTTTQKRALAAAQMRLMNERRRAGSASSSLRSAGHPTKGPQGSQPGSERRSPQPQDRKGYVYLCGEEGDDRYVKIGESRDHPKYRLNGLQTGNPRKLKMLGWLEADDRIVLERALHQKYIHLNVLGEWFRKDPRILQEFPQTQYVIGPIRGTA